MKRDSSQRGFTVVEALISLVLLLVAVMAVAGVLVENLKINRAKQMTVDVQSQTRNCLSLIVDALRSAGWNPKDPASTQSVVVDSGDQITVYADLNEDGTISGPGEQVVIRRNGDRIEWRQEPSALFQTLGVHFTNDADGDGVAEPMFVPDSATAPTKVLVRITGRSALPDRVTGAFIRYTVSSEVLLRRNQWDTEPF